MAAFTDYDDYDAIGLAALVRKGETSATELLEAAIERVAAHDPALNAIVHQMYDDARAAIAAGLPNGPFAGVPYALKDLGLFYKGAPMGHGSRLFADFVPDYDGTMVERQRAAGLVLMAKTSTPEFGLCGTTEPRHYGVTRNPWNLEHSCGGSSGGAAAAVAARMLPFAHATDGGGSIRIPAAQCGLFGLKPTRGRTPQGPVLGEGGGGMSTHHCVSRSVRDSAALLDATHGPAPGDPYAAPPPARPFLDEVGTPPGQLRIALLTTTLDGTPVNPQCVAAVEEIAALCEELGHRVATAKPELSLAALAKAWRVIVGANLWNGINARTQALGRALAPDNVEPVTRAWIDEARQLSATDYAAAVQTMHGAGRTMGGFFQDYDLLLSPTMANPPLPLGQMDTTVDDLDHFYNNLLIAEIPFTPLFNMTGGAAMSVPLAWSDDGLPIGIHFGADAGGEAILLRLAAQLEEARPWADRRPPLLD